MKQNNRKIIINALSSVLQVAITGIIFFFLYRYLVKNLGAEQLGVWSLVLATSSVANLANFGITSGLVKFVAQYNATNRQNELSVLVSTALITIFIFFLILIIILYVIATFILEKVVDSNYIVLAKSILPFSLLSLFINGIGGVFTSVLEGMQKNYIKNGIYSVAILLLFVFTVILTPLYGLKGVAFAQIIQAFLILISTFLFALKYIKTQSSFVLWHKATYKEIMSYGLKFQLISISQMLYEPTTKALLSLFGGLSMVGYYEMASRLVTQLRAVIINANQVMIPVVTEASINTTHAVKNIYSHTLLLSIILSIPLFVFVIILSPAISLVWIGNIETSFIIFIVILSLANLFNIFSGPAYFGFLGEGILNPLIKIHILVAILNIILGFILGYFFQGYGIVIAWCLALSIPSLGMNSLYNKHISLEVLEMVKKSGNIIWSSVIFLILFFLFFFLYKGKISNTAMNSFLLLQSTIYILLISFFLLKFDIIKNNFSLIKAKNK